MPNKQLKSNPLFHRYGGQFDLDPNSSTIDGTYISLFACDDGLTSPETVQVNPQNKTYERNTADWFCYPGSVINNVKIQMYVNVTPSAQESGISGWVYHTTPVCTTFEDVEMDFRDGAQSIGSILKLKKEASTSNMVHPDWNGAKLLNGNTMASTVPGLTSTQKMEGVSFDQDNFDIELSSCELQGKLKQITNGGSRTHII